MKFFARLRSGRKSVTRLFRYGWKITLLDAVAVAGLAVFLFYGAWAQTFDMKKVGEMPERNTVFDVDGKIYSRLAGANRLKVSLSEVSPFFITAVLAREDSRFYDHKGIDWRGIMRALVRDVTSGSAKEGASSITQQLARNSLPLGGRTLSRKLLEAMVALRIERQFTKQQILELYVNRIYFGNGCYGIETASQAYFGKSASKLNLPEAALLAGLIRSPNRFSPLKNPEGAKTQRNAVLNRMVTLKKLSSAEAEEAKRAKITPHPKRLPFIQENYAMDAVQRDLNPLLTQDQIDNGGLSIYTTLDPAVQNATQQALETQLTKIEHQSNFHHPLKASYQPPESGEGDSSMPYLEGAVVVIDNASGGIRALVGGRDYAQSKFNRALALAQTVPHVPAIYIGSFETDLKDLTAAYSVFPNAGVRKQAYVIERIDDQQHKPIYRAAHISVPALDASAAWMTSELMEDVLTSGTAASARSLGFKLPAAGKTGTTNDYKDAWFVGYTSTLTCGVWVGFDQPTTIVAHGYGAALALPVWTQVMNKASRHYPA